MKQMLKWTAPHASMLMKSDEGLTLMELAAKCAKSALDQSIDLEIDLVDAPDCVYDRAHHTGIKSFDALLRKNQGTFITGNVYGDAQVSQYVRAINNTECNGFSFTQGELRKADLKIFLTDPFKFKEFGAIQSWLDQHTDEETIVYVLRNLTKTEHVFGRGDIFNFCYYGYLITDKQHNLLHRHDNLGVRGHNAVLDEAQKFLSYQELQNAVPLVRIKDAELTLMNAEVLDPYERLPQRDRSQTERM